MKPAPTWAVVSGEPSALMSSAHRPCFPRCPHLTPWWRWGGNARAACRQFRQDACGREMICRRQYNPTEHQDGKDKTEFIKAFKAEMKQRQIPFTEINYNVRETPNCRCRHAPQNRQTERDRTDFGHIGRLLNKIKSPLRMLAETNPNADWPCSAILNGRHIRVTVWNSTRKSWTVKMLSFGFRNLLALLIMWIISINRC